MFFHQALQLRPYYIVSNNSQYNIVFHFLYMRVHLTSVDIENLPILRTKNLPDATTLFRLILA